MTEEPIEIAQGRLVGKRLGKYEIQTEIGKGGMGVVYQAYDPLLDRQVAIKVLAPHLVWEPGFVQRFLREARAAARLKHPGIVTIYDVGHSGPKSGGSWHFIVMEYLTGQTLGQIIRQRGPLPPRESLSILYGVAEALDYSHLHGLVHRDVKPGNIVIDSDGQPTLTDFGIARAAQETRLTATGALIGTPQYMSPEQAQGEEVDHRTDIYSLGVAAYEILTGRVPFDATTPHAVLHKVIYEPMPSVRAQRPDLPAEVDQALASALAKEPDDRYGTAMGLAEALGEVLVGQAGAAEEKRDLLMDALSQPTAPPRPREATHAATMQLRRGRWMLWLWWLLASALGWGLGWGLGTPLGEVIARPVGAAVSVPLAEVLGGATTWGVIGVAMGTAQWLVLRRHLQSIGKWIPATATSSSLAGSVKWVQTMLMDAIFFKAIGRLEDIGWGVISPLIGIGIGMVFEGLAGLAIGVAQWLVLRKQLRAAKNWIWISVLGWVAGLLVMGVIGWALGEPDDETMFWIISTMGGIVPGAITGAGLVWLLTREEEERTALA